MEFRLRFDKSPLFLGECSGNQVHRADGEDCGLVLEISVEMGKMVGRACFREHADYDSEEAAQFRHETIVASGFSTLYRPELCGTVYHGVEA